MLRLSFAALCVLAALRAQQPGRGAAQPPARTPSIEERATGMTKIDGLFPVYWEERTGNLYLEIPRLDTPVLYATGIAAGLGSNAEEHTSELQSPCNLVCRLLLEKKKRE